MVLGGTTESGRTERARDTKKKLAGKVGSFRSKPGEVPRVQTGNLRRSITHEVSKQLPIGKVGTNIKYGKMLELGTKKMAPRPYLRPAAHKAEGAIKAIFTRPIEKL